MHLVRLVVAGERVHHQVDAEAVGHLALALAFWLPAVAEAAALDAEAFALAAVAETRLAYVRTGVPAVDATSNAGLQGLGLVLNQRTSVEPPPPLGVDVETDELAFFPLLYWPVTAEQATPSDAALRRLNATRRRSIST